MIMLNKLSCSPIFFRVENDGYKHRDRTGADEIPLAIISFCKRTRVTQIYVFKSHPNYPEI
jgi:hypothetical protein